MNPQSWHSYPLAVLNVVPTVMKSPDLRISAAVFAPTWNVPSPERRTTESPIPTSTFPSVGPSNRGMRSATPSVVFVVSFLR